MNSAEKPCSDQGVSLFLTSLFFRQNLITAIRNVNLPVSEDGTSCKKKVFAEVVFQ